MANGIRRAMLQKTAAARQEAARPAKNVKGVRTMGRMTAAERRGSSKTVPGDIGLSFLNYNLMVDRALKQLNSRKKLCGDVCFDKT